MGERERNASGKRGKAGNLHLHDSAGIMELKRGGRAINFPTNSARRILRLARVHA